MYGTFDLNGTVFRANHTSNVVPIEARFPRDKARVLSELDALLESSRLDGNTAGTLPLAPYSPDYRRGVSESSNSSPPRAFARCSLRSIPLL